MKRVLLNVLAASLLLMLCACGGKGCTWQEQYDLGIRYLSEGNYTEAIIAFTAAIEIDPTQPDAFVGRGDAYIGSGETEENLTAAEKDYLAALELDGLFAEVYGKLADVYLALGDQETAITILRRGVEATGDSGLLSRIDALEGPSAEDIAFAISKASEFCFDWFLDNRHVDVNDTILAEYGRQSQWTYECVNEPGITTVNDVLELAKHYFTENAAQEMIAFKEWVEQEGKLYVSATEGLGGFFVTELEIEVQKDSDTQYTITMYEHWDDEILTFEVHYQYANEFWVFDAPLYEYADVPITVRITENSSVN